MADSHRRTSAPVSRHPQQPSRLQRRAPASLQINRSDWKVAIPLLSPLVSPSSPKDIENWKPDSREASSTSSHHHHHKESEPEKPPVFKKWQHPAAPFHYDSGPRAPRFGGSEVGKSKGKERNGWRAKEQNANSSVRGELSRTPEEVKRKDDKSRLELGAQSESLNQSSRVNLERPNENSLEIGQTEKMKHQKNPDLK
ncbi:unnamed protein product [Citrullus colocynthis]|uniref:Uncharacterized protein n=1 Tax=Citrullus colocynthis TaxID=252529 RepID=A0ABP0ZBK5_9ROSI